MNEAMHRCISSLTLNWRQRHRIRAALCDLSSRYRHHPPLRMLHSEGRPLAHCEGARALMIPCTPEEVALRLHIHKDGYDSDYESVDKA